MIQGNSWELAVAVPIKNNQFKLPKYANAKLSTALVGTSDSSATPSNSGFKTISYLDLDPSQAKLFKHLQYGNYVLIGPSSVAEFKGMSEHKQVTGVDWATNRIFLRTPGTINSYNSQDHISALGTGLAGGWDPHITADEGLIPEGIAGGICCEGFPAIVSGTQVTGYWEGTFPSNQYFGFGIDINSNKIQNLISPKQANGLMSARLLEELDDTTLEVLVGDSHIGGYRKTNAQRLRIYRGLYNPKTTDLTGHYGYLIKQDLLNRGNSSGEDFIDQSLIIPYQYYRIGGRVWLDNTNIWNQSFGPEITDDYCIYMELRPHGLENINTDTEIIRVPVSNNIFNTWTEFSKVGIMQSGLSSYSPPQVRISYANNSMDSGKGGNAVLYIDEVWAEFAGGVNYADVDGCLKFERYNVWPEQNSIEFSQDSDGKYKISSRFDYVYQEFWDQLDIIQEWQRKGYKLNLHTNLNDVTQVLRGTMKISAVKKDLWDLTTRSFTLEFTEE